MINSKQKKLILIDAHALIHRAFHALPPLSTRKGELVNAVYGFLSILFKVLRELQPDYVVATFDLAGPTFRHEEYKEYKATRIKAPDELYRQIEKVRQVLNVLNVPIYEKKGFEADDIIGTIINQIKSKSVSLRSKVKNIIVTGDLDTLQLVGPYVNVYTPKKGIKETVVYDTKTVFQRFGIKPRQMTDFKGLKGDPSDNIPGVPGVGEKTAADLLIKFNTIENLYKALEKNKADINPKLADKLLKNKEQAIFSKYLATIRNDAPIDFDIKKCKLHDYDYEKAVSLLKDMEFYSLIERLPRKVIPKDISETKQGAVKENEIKLERKEKKPVYDQIENSYRHGVLSKEIYNMEKELVPVIESMEKAEIKIDKKHLKKLGKKLDQRLGELEKEIYGLAGIKFNINSPQQLSEILFERLKLNIKGLKKTPGKVISTAASELVKLKDQHKIIDLLLEFRELSKLKSTYVDGLLKLVNPKTSSICTDFDQLGTSTGRLSSKNPNLQNIPVKTELGNEIRKAFVARPGYVFLSADYSQLELRIVASIAKDKEMIRVLKEGGDIHQITAAEVFGIKPWKVSLSERKAAKTLNFGVIYGMSIQGFAQAAKVPFQQAKDFINKYFKEFHGIRQYIDQAKETAAKKGYVESLLGRRRYIPEINSSAWNLKQAAERMAINMPIQGTAADLVKKAMIQIYKLFKEPEIKNSARLLLQVHDELLFEIKEDKVKEVAKEIKNIMENIEQFEVPLKVDLNSGRNWGKLKKLEF